MGENLNAKNLGLAGGILWGLVLFILTLISIATGYGSQFLATIASIYLGYSISLFGSFVGLVHGFVCGFIGLYLIGWLYNWFGNR